MYHAGCGRSVSFGSTESKQNERAGLQKEVRARGHMQEDTHDPGTG